MPFASIYLTGRVTFFPTVPSVESAEVISEKENTCVGEFRLLGETNCGGIFIPVNRLSAVSGSGAFSPC